MALRDKLVAGVGYISLGMGLFLTLFPGASRKFLGWESHEHLARIVGASDLILGAGLLLDRRKAHWMLARSFLNVVIIATYANVLASESPRRKRVIGGIGMMAGPTVIDYLLWSRLREDET